ncbi:dimethylarginine dimethylaminohydrolase family protein [Streptomyces sp. CA-132043]|uniref:dimethylarginine dimethylaminohydrolase family protein n=1 Tax=Streptomyces sp. CA-132043 TaxID=3240048 RepID=UPI003D905794
MARCTAEYAQRPETVLVHDPVPFGALGVLEDIPAGELEEHLLFREQPDTQRFVLQHRAFTKAIADAGVDCRYLMELAEESVDVRAAQYDPNLMFARDAAITLPWVPEVYLPARMAKPLRRTEVPILSAALEALGLNRLEWGGAEDAYLEGGDVVPFSRGGNRCLLIGYARRTTLAAVRRLREVLIPDLADEIFAIELAPWRMNLDGGLLPVAEDVVVAHVPSFLSTLHLDARGQRHVDLFAVLRELEVTIVETGRDASWLQQACNYLCLGDRTVIGYDMATSVLRDLRHAGINVIEIAGDELVKGRGGPRCMSRPVYRPLATAQQARP